MGQVFGAITTIRIGVSHERLWAHKSFGYIAIGSLLVLETRRGEYRPRVHLQPGYRNRKYFRNAFAVCPGRASQNKPPNPVGPVWIVGFYRFPRKHFVDNTPDSSRGPLERVPWRLLAVVRRLSITPIDRTTT